MLKVILADDDKFIRKYFYTLIDWNNCGMEVVLVAKDGAEIIDYLQTQSADIILTDIKMKNVSGLEVAKYVYENHLHTRVILISGYKDFQYAKTAVSYKVFAYIQKPTSYDELYKAIINASEEIMNTRESNEFIRKQIFFDLVSGVYTDKKSLKNKAIKYGINLDFQNAKYSFIMLTVENFCNYIKEYNYTKDGFYNMIENVLRDVSSSDYYHIFLRKNEHILLMAINTDYDEKHIVSKLKLDMDVLKQNLNSIMKIKVDIRIEKTLSDIKDVVSQYDVLSNSLIQKKNELIEKDDTGKINMAISYINSNYNLNLALDDVAEYVGLNPAYFSRYFKNVTNQKFVDYITDIRIERAKNLLENTSLPIKVICHDVGFNNLNYFYKIFKTQIGATPKDYRNKIDG